MEQSPFAAPKIAPRLGTPYTAGVQVSRTSDLVKPAAEVAGPSGFGGLKGCLYGSSRVFLIGGRLTSWVTKEKAKIKGTERNRPSPAPKGGSAPHEQRLRDSTLNQARVTADRQAPARRTDRLYGGLGPGGCRSDSPPGYRPSSRHGAIRRCFSGSTAPGPATFRVTCAVEPANQAIASGDSATSARRSPTSTRHSAPAGRGASTSPRPRRTSTAIEWRRDSPYWRSSR